MAEGIETTHVITLKVNGADKLDGLIAKMTKLTNNVNTLVSPLKSLENLLNENTKTFKVFNDSIANVKTSSLETRLKAVEQDLERIRKVADKAQKSLKGVNDESDPANKAAEFFSKYKQSAAGGAMTALAPALMDAVKDSFAQVRDIANDITRSVNTIYSYTKNFMVAADKIKSEQSLYENLLHSKPGEAGYVSGSTVYRDLLSTAYSTRSSIAATSMAYQRMLMSNAFDPTTEHRDALKMTKLVNMTMVGTGATSLEAQRGLIQFGQAMAAGRMAGDDFRSLRQQVPGFIDMLRRGLKQLDPATYGSGDFTDWNRRGLVTSEKMIKALELMQGEIEEKFRNMPITFGQSIERMKTLWQMFMENLTSNKAFEPIYTALRDLVNDMAEGKFTNLWQTLGGVITTASKAVAQFIDYIRQGLGYLNEHPDLIAKIVKILGSAIDAMILLWVWEHKFGLALFTIVDSFIDVNNEGTKAGNNVQTAMIGVVNAIFASVDGLITMIDYMKKLSPIVAGIAGLLAGFAFMHGQVGLGTMLGSLALSSGAAWLGTKNLDTDAMRKAVNNTKTSVMETLNNPNLAKITASSDVNTGKEEMKIGVQDVRVVDTVKIAQDDLKLLLDAASNEIMMNINSSAPVMNNTITGGAAGGIEPNVQNWINELSQAWKIDAQATSSTISLGSKVYG